MEYANHLNEYAPAWSEAQVAEEVARIREAAKRNHNAEVYKMCYSAIDITTLSCNDSVTSVTEFARKTAEFYQKFPHIPNVASICIYPAFVETVGLAVDGTPMKITSVGGGFPAAQTFLEVKALEVAMAIENGADEVDIVLNVGRMLTGEYDEAANEVEVIRSEMDADVVLKVIIESGALKTPDLIRKASLLSMFAGADFVKTSTGKIDVAATPEAAVVMCQAIRDYYQKTGRKVGFKAAGGVRTAEDGALYYTIVEEILGRNGSIRICSASAPPLPRTTSFRLSKAGRSSITDRPQGLSRYAAVRIRTAAFRWGAGRPRNRLSGTLCRKTKRSAGQPVLPGNRIAGKRPRPYNIRVPESSA